MVKIITALEALAIEAAMEAAIETLQDYCETDVAEELESQLKIFKTMEQRDIEEILNECTSS